ncbi:MAG: T9SS type A sorting domain-containing protein [Balneolia bacterium]|nr:T9SS type A sorting domain-containing protein [Balneolia bacterium]
MKIIYPLFISLTVLLVFNPNQAFAQADWTPRTFEGINMTLYDIHFVNDDLGWAAGERGTILHTSDGGETWSIQYQDENDELELTKIAFTSPSNGVAVGGEIFSSGIIFHTNDGGETWTSFDDDDLWFLESAYAADDQNIWAVGGAQGNQVIAHSSNGGETWNVMQNELGNHALYDVFFIDGQRGWISGLSGNTHYTTNGGESWGNFLTGDQETLISIHMIDAQNGFMASQNGNVYRTTNGTEWNEVGELDFITRDIWFVSESVGYAGVFSGIFSTGNGGIDWDEDEFTSFATVTGFHFFDNGSGWAVGTSGRFWTTEGAVVSIEELDLPRTITLGQNYPNPFNPGAQIEFTLRENVEISLTVYDVGGRMVSQLASGAYAAGTHSVYFNASGLPSGVYFYRLQAAGEMLTGKMMLVK